MPWGYVSGERLAERGRSQSPYPQPPGYGGRPPRDLIETSRRPEDKICNTSCLGPLGPTYLKFERNTVEMAPPGAEKLWQLVRIRACTVRRPTTAAPNR